VSIELALLGQILVLAEDETTSSEHLSMTVANSPMLAASVVQVSNSALYGMEGRVARLERAVLVLGVRTVASIASTVLVAASLRARSIGGISSDAIFLHSLEVGICAQLLAKRLGVRPDSEAYLAGLLHDMGMSELHDAHGAAYTACVERSMRERRALVDVEQETFGETHATRLATSAQGWGFPEKLQHVLGHHHDPENAPEDSRKSASLVQAAHVILAHDPKGWSDFIAEPERDAAFLESLGITPEDAAELLETARKRLEEAATTFGQAMGGGAG
jgi:HD-like signal output (HDOD) protein